MLSLSFFFLGSPIFILVHGIKIFTEYIAGEEIIIFLRMNSVVKFGKKDYSTDFYERIKEEDNKWAILRRLSP